MSTKKEYILRHLSTASIFKDCPQELLLKMAEDAHTIKINKGQMLFNHLDPANRFFIVCSGWVKLYRETIDGSQAVIDIVQPGDAIGETAIFEKNKYPFCAEGTERATLLSLNSNHLKQALETQPQMAIALLSAMADRRNHQDRELEHRTLQNAPQRIGCFLLRLANQQETGPVQINLPYDKTLLAARLGMQPETFSRALARLKKETGIKVKGAMIELESLSILSEYSCATCSSEFPCKDLIKA